MRRLLWVPAHSSGTRSRVLSFSASRNAATASSSFARAALDTIGENAIPTEQLGAKLIEIAVSFKALQETTSAQPVDDPKIAALLA
jgi:hypothetical protein